MKNRKLTYLLILIVAGIWGIILRRIVSYAAPEPTQESVQERESPLLADSISYALSLDYPDPFGETSPSRSVVPRHSTGGEAFPEPEPIEPPAIHFKGVIRQKNSLYAILESNGHSDILRFGETIDEFRLAAVTPDSVILKKGVQSFILKLH